jgi:hypothetical protein
MRGLICKVFVAVTVSVLFRPVAVKASELRPETLKGWNEYIEAESSRVGERSSSGKFLWSDESPERHRRVHSGEIVIAPVGETVPMSVEHGLIHHWVGAMFVPNARLEDVLAVVRDYRRYKEFYAPNVLDSKLLQTGGDNDKFSMLMLNKALFSKTALDAEFRGSYVQLNKGRGYSIAYSTRVQEVEDYGQPDQRELPPNAGHGYIWRLYSLSRFEERDGGVYIELEAIALSRDIPGSVRWLVNPIVRRVSKGSLLVSLQKTQEAVRSTSEVASRPVKKDVASGGISSTTGAEAISLERSLLPFTQ